MVVKIKKERKKTLLSKKLFQLQAGLPGIIFIQRKRKKPERKVHTQHKPSCKVKDELTKKRWENNEAQESQTMFETGWAFLSPVV